jgi:hypothetical protein
VSPGSLALALLLFAGCVVPADVRERAAEHEAITGGYLRLLRAGELTPDDLARALAACAYAAAGLRYQCDGEGEPPRLEDFAPPGGWGEVAAVGSDVAPVGSATR